MKQEYLYGIHAIEKLIKQSPQAIFNLIVQKGPLNKRVQSIVDQAKKLGLVTSQEPKSFFNKIDGVHQGIVAIVAKQAVLTEADLVQMIKNIPNPVFLFLDEVQDPHNLGAILRSADATGVDAVIIPKHNSVGINATVRKVASGAVETVKLVAVSNLTRCIKDMQKAGMWVTGLAAETKNTIFDIDFKGSVGIVMGTEATGLRKLTKENCDYLASIPMRGSVESLNVSVAAGVVLYEVIRQRSL